MSGGEQVPGPNGGTNGGAGGGTNGGTNGGGPGMGEAPAGVVAGLVREVEALRRAVRPVPGLRAEVSALSGQVEQLAQTVADAVDQMSAAGSKDTPVRPVSWIADPAADRAPEHPAYDPTATDPQAVARRLAELCGWVARVYVAYRPAGQQLPACWLWHPDIVEELAWLMQAWTAAYDPEAGSLVAVADWHDRWRPGVAVRVKLAAAGCSLHEHPGPHRAGGLPLAPPAGSAAAIARWWTCARDQPPPAPTEQDFTHAARRLRENTR